VAILRALLIVLSVVGLLGQATVRAMPMAALVGPTAASAAAGAEHCAEMDDMGVAEEAPAHTPCKGMTGDCIGKMGCALSVIEPAMPPAQVVPVRYHAVAYQDSSQTHPSLSVSPELFPPIALS